MNKKFIKSVLLCRCPQCHEGKIYKSYLNLQDECLVCSWNMRDLMLGDAASWLTILLAGHFCVPIIYLQIHYQWEIWLSAIISPLFLAVACLVILPISKSFFVSMSFKNQSHNNSDT